MLSVLLLRMCIMQYCGFYEDEQVLSKPVNSLKKKKDGTKEKHDLCLEEISYLMRMIGRHTMQYYTRQDLQRN